MFFGIKVRPLAKVHRKQKKLIERYVIYLKNEVFLSGNAKWLNNLPSAIKQKKTIHHSIKTSPNHAFQKSNEGEVYLNRQDKRDKQTRKFKLGQLVRLADIKKVFSRGGSTNISFILYTKIEAIHDTIPSYRFEYLPEGCNQSFLRSTKLSLD